MRPDELRAALGAFDPAVPIESAFNPPPSWYVEPTFLELERRAVFSRSWLAACRIDQLPHPGSWVGGDTLGMPWVVLRDSEGGVRAFHSVCRHRATVLHEGEGRCEQIVCPYHGWTYDLRGRLQSAPGMAGVGTLDRDALSLVPIATAEFWPYIFIHLGEEPPPLEALVEPLVQPILAGKSTLRFHERRSYAVDCNWKVYVDNYLDGGYHVPHLHGELAASLDLDGYRVEVFDRTSIQSCGGAGPSERTGGGSVYAWLYPNLMLNRYGPVLDVNIVRPLSQDRTEVLFDYYFEEGAEDPTPEFIEASLRTSEGVQREDERICASVQRGLASEHATSGPYAPRIEVAEHQFHRILSADFESALVSHLQTME